MSEKSEQQNAGENEEGGQQQNAGGNEARKRRLLVISRVLIIYFFAALIGLSFSLPSLLEQIVSDRLYSDAAHPLTRVILFMLFCLVVIAGLSLVAAALARSRKQIRDFFLSLLDLQSTTDSREIDRKSDEPNVRLSTNQVKDRISQLLLQRTRRIREKIELELRIVSLRSFVNSLIGVIFGLLGIIMAIFGDFSAILTDLGLVSTEVSSTANGDTKQTASLTTSENGETAQTAPLMTPENIADLVPYVLIAKSYVVVLCNVLALVFLTLFVRGLWEIRYYRNELTTVDSWELAILMAERADDNNTRSTIALMFASVDRNRSAKRKKGGGESALSPVALWEHLRAKAERDSPAKAERDRPTQS